ncbi:Fe-S oxidoreductase [Candidatus Magnetomorum sp. HK-1]|nr:Fe-S oxidoreductase [Candidatus Magnetomorum sp. HK-1]
MARVLFVYPNKESYPLVPLSISLFSGILKKAGHKVDIFDITFMVKDRFVDHYAREKFDLVKKVDVEKYWGKCEQVDLKKELIRKIDFFKPDIIAFSIVENNFAAANDFISFIKSKYNIPIIVGGIFPTVVPELFLNNNNIDIICIGEGENSILELANRIDKDEYYGNIPNLIVKHNGKTIKNKLGPYYNWDPLMYQDWDLFDKRHFLKPFMGKMWKTGYFELSRGCPYHCTYCVNSKLQGIYKGIGLYRREKNIDELINEIAFMKEKYQLELIWFYDENFCMLDKEKLIKFCHLYKANIDLPYFVATRADTLLDEKIVKMLKDSGCATVGVGLETGSETTRICKLKKNIKNTTFFKAFDICKKFKLRTTANIMLGLPEETESDIHTSISFCKKLNPDSLSISIFVPYHGTHLREECINKGLIEDSYDETISFHYNSTIKMTKISKQKFYFLYENFNKLVYEVAE